MSIAEELEKTTVYPNPVNSQLVVKCYGQSIDPQIQVYNSTGMLVREMEGGPLTQIDVGEMPEGVYFIRLKGRGSKVLKFVKE